MVGKEPRVGSLDKKKVLVGIVKAWEIDDVEGAE